MNRKTNHGYDVHLSHFCIDAFVDVDEEEHWMKCPACNQKPKIWTFNNGRMTACGCWNDRYDHFSVYAESVMSIFRRCGGNVSEYCSDSLRKNWNEYCSTHVNSCNHADLRMEGKW